MPLLVTQGMKKLKRRKRLKTGHGAPLPDALFRWYEKKYRSTLRKYFAPAMKQAIADRTSEKSMAEIYANLTALLEDLYAELKAGMADDLDALAAKIDRYSRQRFEASVKKTMGIDAMSILSPVIENERRRKLVEQNVELIKDELHQFNDLIFQAVVADYSGTGFPDGSKSLAERIQNVSDMEFKHAKFVARDQTAKMNGLLAQARQVDAGVTHYVWRTAKDQRVVGNPAGKYPVSYDPTMHGDHWKREGKVFSWDNPPPDGHPGFGIGCRCYAAPILDIKELRFMEGV